MFSQVSVCLSVPGQMVVYPSIHLGEDRVGCEQGGGGHGDKGLHTPPMMLTEAGSTHPTGMHSCLSLKWVLYSPMELFTRNVKKIKGAAYKKW